MISHLFTASIIVTNTCSDSVDLASQQIYYPPKNLSIRTSNNCSWTIKVPENRVVILRLKGLNLSNPSNLKIYDGPNSNFATLGYAMAKNIESSGRNIHLVYTSTMDKGTDYFKIGYNQSGSMSVITFIIVSRNSLFYSSKKL